MLMQVVVAILVVWALFKFGGRIAGLLNKTFDIADSGVTVAHKHVQSWEQDVDAKLSVKRTLAEEERNEQVEKLNELRVKKGKKPLKVE